MKINLGCGYQKMAGYLNVDNDPACRPDQLVDLEKIPWPFADNSVQEILAAHVIEHLGQTPQMWMEIWKELWRVSANGCLVKITVPHPRHDNFLADPTHVRPILPDTIAMFDQSRNIRMYENGGLESKLGLRTGVDLEIEEVRFDLNEPWASAQAEKKMSHDELHRDLAILNNVCFQIHIVARIVKPARGTEWLKNLKL